MRSSRINPNPVAAAVRALVPTVVLGAGLAWLVSAYRFPGSRVFAWMLGHLPFVRSDHARVRSDEYPIRLWTVAVFLFGVLPVARARGISCARHKPSRCISREGRAPGTGRRRAWTTCSVGCRKSLPYAQSVTAFHLKPGQSMSPGW